MDLTLTRPIHFDLAFDMTISISPEQIRNSNLGKAPKLGQTLEKQVQKGDKMYTAQVSGRFRMFRAHFAIPLL